MAKKHQPTEESRKTVKAMTAYGIPQLQICAVLDIHDDTLRLYYKRELETAAPQANAEVAQSLFQMATKGKNVAAAIFWLKTRSAWKEVVHVANEDADKPFLVVTGVPRE